MALNLADRKAIRPVIVPRCTAVVANYALYILGEDAGTANHANRLAWAREAIRDPDRQGEFLSWYVLNAPEYLAGGSDITDATLTGVVEAAVNNNFIQPAA
jgi:hypothetical protein